MQCCQFPGLHAPCQNIFKPLLLQPPVDLPSSPGTGGSQSLQTGSEGGKVPLPRRSRSRSLVPARGPRMKRRNSEEPQSAWPRPSCCAMSALKPTWAMRRGGGMRSPCGVLWIRPKWVWICSGSCSRFASGVFAGFSVLELAGAISLGSAWFDSFGTSAANIPGIVLTRRHPFQHHQHHELALLGSA